MSVRNINKLEPSKEENKDTGLKEIYQKILFTKREF